MRSRLPGAFAGRSTCTDSIGRVYCLHGLRGGVSGKIAAVRVAPEENRRRNIALETARTVAGGNRRGGRLHFLRISSLGAGDEPRQTNLPQSAQLQLVRRERSESPWFVGPEERDGLPVAETPYAETRLNRFCRGRRYHLAGCELRRLTTCRSANHRPREGLLQLRSALQ